MERLPRLDKAMARNNIRVKLVVAISIVLKSEGQ